MASIQEDVSKQMWDLFLKFIGTGSEFVYQIGHENNVALKHGYNFASQIITALINKRKEENKPVDDLTQMLRRQEKGESIITMPIAAEEAAEFSLRLKAKEVLYNFVENPYDDTKILMYMSNDMQKVNNIVNLHLAEKGMISELNVDLFLDNYAKDSIGTITGLDSIDLAMFRRYAKDNNLVYSAVTADEKGNSFIVYDPKDAALAKKVMGMTLFALSGKDGERLREQMNGYLKNKHLVEKTLLEPEKEYYIVDAKNPEQFVHLTANELTYFKKAKEILAVKRSDREYLERGKRVFEGMDMPILFTREEYEVFIKKDEIDLEGLKKTIEVKAKNLPKFEEIIEAQRKRDERLRKIEEKIVLDEDHRDGFWIFEDSIDYAEAGGHDMMEEEAEQLKHDHIDARSRAKKYKFSEVGGDERSVDTLISKAEKERLEPKEEPETPTLDL